MKILEKKFSNTQEIIVMFVIVFFLNIFWILMFAIRNLYCLLFSYLILVIKIRQGLNTLSLFVKFYFLIFNYFKYIIFLNTGK